VEKFRGSSRDDSRKPAKLLAPFSATFAIEALTPIIPRVKLRKKCCAGADHSGTPSSSITKVKVISDGPRESCEFLSTSLTKDSAATPAYPATAFATRQMMALRPSYLRRPSCRRCGQAGGNGMGESTVSENDYPEVEPRRNATLCRSKARNRAQKIREGQASSIRGRFGTSTIGMAFHLRNALKMFLPGGAGCDFRSCARGIAQSAVHRDIYLNRRQHRSGMHNLAPK